MNAFENYGTTVLLRHEGSQQLGSALAGSMRALLRRLLKLLVNYHSAPTGPLL